MNILCKMGLHKLKRQYSIDKEHSFEWEGYISVLATHDECVRCGKRYELKYQEGFDGTDNA